MNADQIKEGILKSLESGPKAAHEITNGFGLPECEIRGTNHIVTATLHAMVAAGTIARVAHDGLMGTGPKRYHLPGPEGFLS